MRNVLLVLAFTVFICFPLNLYAAEFHVSESGTDSGVCGPIDTPCKTLFRAVLNAGSGTNTIKVATGTYTDTLTLKDVTLQGGWNETFSSHSCAPEKTMLRPPQSSLFPVISVTTDSGNASNVTIECLDVDGQSNGNHGIHIGANNVNSKIDFTLRHSIVESFTRNAIRIMASDRAAVSINIEDSSIRNTEQLVDTGNAGAGVKVVAVSYATVTFDLKRNRITGNISKSAAGALALQAGQGASLAAMMENNLFANNKSRTSGGAVSASTDSNPGSIDLDFINNTITANESVGGFGGGISLNSTSNKISVLLRNTIIWGNSAAYNGQDVRLAVPPWAPNDGSGINVDYSIINDVYVEAGNYVNGTHNISGDPRLTDSLLLESGSPAIDAAQCGFKAFGYHRVAPYDDIEGESRPGFGQLAGCDIGADEYHGLLCFPVKSSSGTINILCI